MVGWKVCNGAAAQGTRKVHAELYIKGSMKLAGPLTDNAGGAVVLEVSDEAAAKALAANDAAVESGIFVYEMHPWKLQPWAQWAKKAKSAVLAVGHSCGGAVITNAVPQTKNVVGLVYVAAFAPDEGELLGDVVGKSKEVFFFRQSNRCNFRPVVATRLRPK